MYFGQVGPDALNQESVVALASYRDGLHRNRKHTSSNTTNTSTFQFLDIALQDLDTVVTKTDSKNPRMVDYLVCRADLGGNEAIAEAPRDAAASK